MKKISNTFILVCDKAFKIVKMGGEKPSVMFFVDILHPLQ